MDERHDPDYLGAEELRLALGISTATYFRWLREGKLRGVRAGRRWRFPRGVVDELLRFGRSAPAESRRVLEAAAATFASLLAVCGFRTKEIEAMKKSADIKALGAGAPLARMILEHACKRRASRVHLEPVAAGLEVRERIDGVLAPVGGKLPAGAAGEVMRAFKRMAGLPADAPAGASLRRFVAQVSGRPVCVQASTYPSGLGESITLGILDADLFVPALDPLGFSPHVCRALRELIRRPSGVLIVNGPTESGKTTTLYSLLADLRGPDVKIMTVEDPIEFYIDGVQQAALDAEHGLTFAEALRAMCRNDVDVALVSEIRDAETLRMVFTVAGVGRRVLSVLHARDAVAAVIRLIDAGGVSRSMLAENLLGILNQRLLRCACPACADRKRIRPEDACALGLSGRDARRAVVYNRGCAECRETGLQGRLAVGELLTMTPALRAALESGVGPAELRAAVPPPAHSLRQAVLDRLFEGRIAPAEARRVLGEEMRNSG